MVSVCANDLLSRTDISKDEKIGNLGSQQGLIELAATVFYQVLYLILHTFVLPSLHFISLVNCCYRKFIFI